MYRLGRGCRYEHYLKYMRTCLNRKTGKTAALVCVLLLVVATLFVRLLYIQSYLDHVQSILNNVRKYEHTIYRRIHYIRRPHYISSDVFEGCQYSCYFTESDTLEDDTDNLIVIWRDLPDVAPPKPRNQIWVYHSMEPPPLHGKSYASWKKLFNWTISYRRDSDIYSPYGIIEKKENIDKNITSQNLSINWDAKTKDVVWFVSNCKSFSMRYEYAVALNKTVDVDMFGQCGDQKCDEKWPICAKKLQSIYRYYLSFENSLCRDYITEKSFKIYESLFDAIPIVRNGAFLNHYLPPGSYISTKDFHSVEYLGNFLKVLENTKKTPSTYFNWRKHYVARDMIQSNETFCELCRRSHTDKKYQKVYNDFETWLRGGEDNSFCLPVADIQ
ncbi:alpha-(1,3)-fucosyltransferase C-like [Pecten maximus]|uniref:alpha-(1,3)-fucosyltransferase C-like n=1 Tax=Pecten maximus TaxID=6579 RepID=UPI001458BB63|nr:alpha-(1,3)-fucosyltransferase C-like [Pecten maximus]